WTLTSQSLAQRCERRFCLIGLDQVSQLLAGENLLEAVAQIRNLLLFSCERARIGGAGDKHMRDTPRGTRNAAPPQTAAHRFQSTRLTDCRRPVEKEISNA